MPFLNWINDDIARRQYKNVAFHLLEKQEHYGASDANNLLIQGDNLIALRALLPFYKGKVKCIYIDPPYNTGNAFEHYDDGLAGILHESFFPATHPSQPLPGGVFHMLRRLQVSNGRGMPQLSAPVLMAASRGNADFLCTLPVKHNDGPAQTCRSSSASAHSLRSRLFEPVSRLRRAVLLV